MTTRLDYDALHSFATTYVVDPYYRRQQATLLGLTLTKSGGLLKRKNPYLFRAKNIQTSGEFVKYALDAFLSSSEETMFGNFLERLAIHICGEVYGGYKAPSKVMPSVDLIFTREDNCYVVGIKSGPNWGNADQLRAMARNFKAAKALLVEQGVQLPIAGVNGCMYGIDELPWKSNLEDPELSYYKFCGQRFWAFISGDADLYLRLIQPLGVESKQRSTEFFKLYNAKINELTAEFSAHFLSQDNQIDWDKLIRFVSASQATGESSKIGHL